MCVCACERLHAPPLRKSCIRACNMPSRSVEIGLKQPPQRRPKLAIHCWVPLSLYCRVSPYLLPGLTTSTASWSRRVHDRVLPYPLPGPATTTAGSRRLYCRVPPSLLLGPAISTAWVPPSLLLGPAVSTVSLQSTNTQAHQAAYLADSVPDTMTLHEPTRSIQASNLSDTCRQGESV